jgi:hypothetical protein
MHLPKEPSIIDSLLPAETRRYVVLRTDQFGNDILREALASPTASNRNDILNLTSSISEA